MRFVGPEEEGGRLDTDSHSGGHPLPLVALLAAPVLACFVGGVIAAAANAAQASAPPPVRPDNVIPFKRVQRRI